MKVEGDLEGRGLVIQVLEPITEVYPETSLLGSSAHSCHRQI